MNNKELETQRLFLSRVDEEDVICFYILLKDNYKNIGTILFHLDSNDFNCFIDDAFRKMGYATEACQEVIKVLFLNFERKIDSLFSSISIDNKEALVFAGKLGFMKSDNMQIAFLELKKNDFLRELFRREKLFIEKSIDKVPYITHVSDDFVMNVTGESGSGKSTFVLPYKKSFDCIIIDTDQVFGNHKKNSDAQIFYSFLMAKYQTLPNLCDDFDQVYQDILECFSSFNKMIIIDSAQFRNMKNLSLLKGDVIVLRTCIDTCYQRCLSRFQELHPNSSFEEFMEYSDRKKNIYKWFHLLNQFLSRLDKIYGGDDLL